MIINSDDKNNFPHELLLTNKQVTNLRKAFTDNSQLILNYEELNYPKWNNQENFLVAFLVHY